MTDQSLTACTDLRTLFEGYYAPRKLRGCAPNTAVQYGMTIKRLAEFLRRPPMITDLNEDVLCRFLEWRRLKVSAATCNKDRSQLLALANFAGKRGLITVPDVDAEKEPERIPLAWLDTDLAKLWRACDCESGWIAGVPASLFWKALHQILWDTGERVGAIIKARWENLDLETGWLLVKAENRKGSTRDKRYKLHADTIAVLRAIMHPQRTMIFPWPYCRTYLWYRYGKLLEKAGLPHGRKDKFHRMRKSVASHAEAAGLDATAILDHSDRKVTKSYLDPRLTAPKQPADVLFRPGQ